MTNPSLPVETVLRSTNSMYLYAFTVYFCHISELSIDLQLHLTLSFLAEKYLFQKYCPVWSKFLFHGIGELNLSRFF